MNVFPIFAVHSSENFVHEIPDGFEAQGIFILEKMQLIWIMGEVLNQKRRLFLDKLVDLQEGYG